jgi:hypothetical protein
MISTKRKNINSKKLLLKRNDNFSFHYYIYIYGSNVKFIVKQENELHAKINNIYAYLINNVDLCSNFM